MNNVAKKVKTFYIGLLWLLIPLTYLVTTAVFYVHLHPRPCVRTPGVRPYEDVAYGDCRGQAFNGAAAAAFWPVTAPIHFTVDAVRADFQH